MTRLVNISEAASLALHGMVLLAGGGQRRFTNQEMASRLNASGHHLAKVMQRLVKVGLVDSVCGPQGGFLLGRPAEQITLLRIYEAVEGPLEAEGCLLPDAICQGGVCVLGEVLQSIQEQLRDYLDKTTLDELANDLRLGAPAGDTGDEP